MRTSESTASFYKAFCAAQAKVGGAVKEARNEHLNRTYADLASIWAACKEGLSEQGIGVIQAPEPVEGFDLCCVTRLVHGESGEWIESLLPLIVLKNDMQGLGSAFTYAKRYALAGMVGVWTEDDDGESAAVRPMPDHRDRVRDGHRGDRGVRTPRGVTEAPAASWAALLARGVREANERWRNEQAIANVPTADRKDLLSQEQVINGLVKRALNADPPLLAADEVTTDGKRDLTKAKAALVRLHRAKPRKMQAALETYLDAKLRDGIEALSQYGVDEPADVNRPDADLDVEVPSN